MFKKLRSLFILILLLILATKYSDEIKRYAENYVLFSYCDTPIKYKLGTIDSQFKLTSTQLEAFSADAADIWNNAYAKKLFEYDPQALLTINMVYDERQGLIGQITKATTTVESGKDLLNQSIAAFEEKKKQVLDELNKLNAEIQYWNGKGGAPEDKYNEIKQKQMQLHKEIEQLNIEAQQLNQTTEDLNKGITTLNGNVDNFNDLLNIKPEEGLYTSIDNTIKIFIYTSEEQVTHTIAHEFGHALGLDHIEVAGAIMNPVSSADTKLSSEDMDILQERCKQQNRFELFGERLRLIFDYYFNANTRVKW